VRCDASLAGWQASGASAIHAVYKNPKYAVMIWSGGPNTIISPTIHSSNILGAVYVFSALIAPAVYANWYEGTTWSDQLRIDIVNANTGALIKRMDIYSGAYDSPYWDFKSTSFSYTGDGTGDIKIKITAAAASTGRFAGAISDVQLRSVNYSQFNCSLYHFVSHKLLWCGMLCFYYGIARVVPTLLQFPVPCRRVVPVWCHRMCQLHFPATTLHPYPAMGHQ